MPPAGRVLDAEAYVALVDAALDGWLTTGRFNDEFEGLIAQRIGVKRALTTNSGSSANLLALSALTSPLLGKRALQARRRSHHGCRGVPDHHQSYSAKRSGPGIR